MPFLVFRREQLRSKPDIICVSIWGSFAALYKSPYKDLIASPKIFIASSAPQLSVLDTTYETVYTYSFPRVVFGAKHSILADTSFHS